jgi:UDPglucose 6-dehydrogenase
MKIAVIGTGYVGLTTGTCFAETGNEVVCVDIDKKKITNLNKGIIPIYEPGLDDLVKKMHKSKLLSFSIDTPKAIKFADVVFSAVGTPPGKDYRADLKYVKEVAKSFGQHANGYKVFVNKSTVPVGTGDACKEIIEKEFAKRKVDFSFDIISNPEFLREGTAIGDTLHAERVVVGYESPRAKKIMKNLYKPFEKNGAKLLFTDIKTSEIIKYASNSMLATKISFINEIANFCEKAGGDVKTVAKGMGLDSRIGSKFLRAGVGYGGSCFPKDVQALIQTGKDFGYNFRVIKATEEVNKTQKLTTYKKLKKVLGPLKGKRIAIWGLAFKPNTDDMRDAPSIEIIKALQKDGAHIQAYDPVAIEIAKTILPKKNLTYAASALDALKNADALMIVTEWEEFASTPPSIIATHLKGNLVVDGRNIFKRASMKKPKLKYVPVGQG